MTNLILIAIFLCYLPVNAKAGMSRKYLILVENVTPCPDNEKLESPMRNVVFKSINRTHKSISYDVTFKRPLDENIGGSGILEILGNTGWMQMPFMPFYADACNTMMKFFHSAWVEYVKSFGVKDPEKCPIPAGKYKIKNYNINLNNINIPSRLGKYRFRQMFQTVDTRKTIFCIAASVNLKEDNN